ncbi:MAG: hypothetical protein A2431_02920 [Candidatus Zambryskibacteria bacterium RIFOXYC1_FULL_39_10]|uniref:Uncharacterized protein n=1 Tax=Candidatus Zambryskibacteria bacterium RIFOXYC1_FULL_39_10 TaxID=1802779 RepID=A0A1G2V011_9BACT|nr:MAG: hypothetical protein A2605_02150 [Candidatus Zambryskibacteria bacterium RIFOXYD1_FULL_39_35]OHB14975.1 MAG: hypothetical protein A2431_02920 [Candidatus Zambryskibacteria bacterium RIFOXYC1_FULL_39_10]
MDYKDTIKERLNLLSSELKSFVLNENWRKDAENTGKKYNLNEEKYASLENEIFFVLLCFEPKSDFVENIKRELEIDSNMAGWIAEDVNKNIFSQVEKEIDQMWASGSTDVERETETSEEKNTNNIGQSFEEIILNQARAMQPAREAIPPENLPIENSEPRAIHNYIKNNDPYREPVE